MRIEYSYSIDDFTEVIAAEWKRNPRVREMKVLAWFIGAMLIWTGSVMFEMSIALHEPILALAGATELIAILFLADAALMTPARAAKATYSATLAGNESYTAEIQENGVLMTSPHSTTDCRWSRFDRTFESSTVIAIFDRNLMYLFPKRFFTEQQVEEFRRLISQNIQQDPRR
jgi:hypothetical protein